MVTPGVVPLIRTLLIPAPKFSFKKTVSTTVEPELAKQFNCSVASGIPSLSSSVSKLLDKPSPSVSEYIFTPSPSIKNLNGFSLASLLPIETVALVVISAVGLNAIVKVLDAPGAIILLLGGWLEMVKVGLDPGSKITGVDDKIKLELPSFLIVKVFDFTPELTS